MWKRFSGRALALTAGAALLAGTALTTGCSSDPGDRRYCVQLPTEVRVDDRPCELGTPGHAWRYVERSNHRPRHGERTTWRTYDHPVDDRGRATKKSETRVAGSSDAKTTGKTGSTSRSGSSGKSGSPGRSGSSSRR